MKNDVPDATASAQQDQFSVDALLPSIYAELRRLAQFRISQEKPGQTLQATALVHEAYLRLVGEKNDRQWEGRSHFYTAAAESMRRILVENARRKKRLKHGGDFVREPLTEIPTTAVDTREDLLALDDALNKLAQIDREAAELIQLRYFAGLSFPDVAEAMGISTRTVQRKWDYARAWLHCEMNGAGDAT